MKAINLKTTLLFNQIYLSNLPSWAQRRSYTVESLGLQGTILLIISNMRWKLPLIGLFNAYNALQESLQRNY